MSPPPFDLLSLGRREALKLLAAGAALPLAACSPPDEEIVPYVDMPERLVPGESLRFATVLPLGGYGRGVIVTSREGRPTKIEGNPRHPASLGATDLFAEAEILTLYDPDRSQAVRGPTPIASWSDFEQGLLGEISRQQQDGNGLRLLTRACHSPTLRRQVTAILGRFPGARWHAYDPMGEEAQPLYRLAEAKVLVSLMADPLGPGPRQIMNAKAFAKGRTARGGDPEFLRLYAFEPGMTLTGANADHRVALTPTQVEAVAEALAGDPSAPLPEDLPAAGRAAVSAARRDLHENPGRAVVIPGPALSQRTRALCHRLNSRLRAPVEVPAPPEGPRPETLAALTEDLRADRVGVLLILDANPAYDAPGDLGMAALIPKAAFSAHVGLYEDETASLCDWHLPSHHSLEDWSDLEAPDGTAAVAQPLIRPLYDTRSPHHVLGLLDGRLDLSAYQAVRQTWRASAAFAGQGTDFETWWRRILHDGVVAGSARPGVAASEDLIPPATAEDDPSGLVLVLQPDPSVWDGSRANNAWLQECPKPLTKQVWGNAVHMAPDDAHRLGFSDGEVIELRSRVGAVEAPVHVDQGQAPGTLTGTFGYGRQRAGAIGTGLGYNAYRLRRTTDGVLLRGIQLLPTGRRQPILTTQAAFELEGEAAELLPTLSLAELARRGDIHSEAPEPTLLPEWIYDRHRWAMVIDTTLCIGCNACVVACQAENNVPIVGPEEVAAGRIMHWLRIDRYDVPTAHGERTGFEPVPCMHCEHAPCEPVCPVEASVHDSEGLNVQVYNRCVGTRFCQANCPYKVRRFNFHGYAQEQAYADLDAESLKAQHNPDVTVRARGVMEKCTYCVQRISRARRQAEKEDRPIGEGEVVTACQSACPTDAIVFGDRARSDSAVNRLRTLPQHFALLGHLGTQPRTTYLARLFDPADEPEEAAS